VRVCRFGQLSLIYFVGGRAGGMPLGSSAKDGRCATIPPSAMTRILESTVALRGALRSPILFVRCALFLCDTPRTPALFVFSISTCR
jgi:hypothetical protein